jgi:hypothetical protein
MKLSRDSKLIDCRFIFKAFVFEFYNDKSFGVFSASVFEVSSN